MACATLAALAACSNQGANTSKAASNPAPSASTPPPPTSGAKSSAPAATSAPHSSRFASKRWGFTIEYPADWQLHHDFHHSYLQSGAWKIYAAPDSQGVPIIAMTLPGSDNITDAELRIGIGTAPAEVAECATPPQAVRAGSVDEVTIGGIHFAHFEAGDAAMSHYLDVHSYRTVHDGHCYAIDLLVYGTNPKVYSPPAKPPFSHQQAFAKLRAVLNTFRFTR